MKNNRCAAAQTNEILNRKHTNQFKHTTNIQTQTSRIENEKRIATKTADNKKRKFFFSKKPQNEKKKRKTLTGCHEEAQSAEPMRHDTGSRQQSRLQRYWQFDLQNSAANIRLHVFQKATIEKMQKMSRFQIANIDRYRE